MLLLDKGDVASGTTSWSSRLIHGGLRYLERGEAGLVRESLRERERLLRTAPHLVQPLPMLIPIYHGQRRGPVLIRASMALYDALSLDKSLPRHQMLDASAAQRRAPGLWRQGLRGAALYSMARSPSRNDWHWKMRSTRAPTERDCAPTIRWSIFSLPVDTQRVSPVTMCDRRAVRAKAPVVLNVAGPWVDAVLAGTPAAHRTRLMGGTKGSHIVVAPFPGAPHDALYSEARGDGRPFFIIPWNDVYLIGTTDVRYDGDLDDIVADEAEIAFLLAETNQLMRAPGLAPADVRYAYAGGCVPHFRSRQRWLREASAAAITSTIMGRRVVRVASLDCRRQADDIPRVGRTDR